MVRNPHLLTIFANFAQRRLDTERYPISEALYETEQGVRILVHEQQARDPRGHILMVHGLEGSSDAGYMRSLSQLALESGYSVHRTNLRSCGGSEAYCNTMYHAGLTSDTLAIAKQVRAAHPLPLFLIGFSLGGNVILKLAGELGEGGSELLAGVIGVSTPIDLGACVRKMSELQNRVYEWRFLSRLKQRIRRRAERMPGQYSLSALDSVKSVYEFDDKLTAQFFEFGSADNYYATQSCQNFLANIQIPTLLVQAKDDPLIPFEIFSHPAIDGNDNIQLFAVEHGGHLGFLANAAPRFWLDRVVMEWIDERISLRKSPPAASSDYLAARKARPSNLG